MSELFATMMYYSEEKGGWVIRDLFREEDGRVVHGPEMTAKEYEQYKRERGEWEEEEDAEDPWK